MIHEKEDLINALQEDVDDLQKEKDKIETLKEKSNIFVGD